jgi:hypothetical protein
MSRDEIIFSKKNIAYKCVLNLQVMIKYFFYYYLFAHARQILTPQNKELSVIYPDPTFNNLLIIQE